TAAFEPTSLVIPPPQSWTSYNYRTTGTLPAVSLADTAAPSTAAPPSNSGPGGNGGGGNGDGGGNGGGGNGGGGSGGNGGGGGGGGEGGPGAIAAAPGSDPASAIDQWQLNYKLNVAVVPEWDGKDGTLIKYVIDMSCLALLSPRMVRDIAHMAPSKFTDRAQRWWITLPIARRLFYCQDWDHLLDAIRRQFLTAQWLLDRTRDFEEMRFRQKGEETEEPLDFFQRRAQSHAFIFADVEDGPSTVARILRTQPVEWTKDVNERACPDIDSLLTYAQHNRASLLSTWLVANKVDTILAGSSASTASPRRRFGRVNTAGHKAEDVSEESESEEESEKKAALNVDRRRNKTAANPSPKVPWPGEKTIDGYEFKRDDSVSSLRPPTNGDCYICTSPKHLARDCPHFNRWDALRRAHLILVDVEPEVEERDLREYIAMHVESKPASSYSSDSPERSEVIKEALVVVAPDDCGPEAAHDAHYGLNRNRRRREASEVEKTSRMDKGKAVKSDDPPKLPRRELRKPSKEVKFTVTQEEGGPPIHIARRVRHLPDGLGSLGARALHVKVKVGSLEYEAIKARLDSGADITLMSEDFWASIPGLPKPKEGIRMTLYHLTGQAKVLGYVKTPIFMATEEGEVVSFEMEAYVVRNMQVPLLLGEDFQ
ncbi:hypothetical protein B0H12DRAFT_969518, partial [Mycena haematopus]